MINFLVIFIILPFEHMKKKQWGGGGREPTSYILNNST